MARPLKTLKEARTGLIIDRDFLGEIVETHSIDFYEIGRACAYAVDIRDTCKKELKVLYAQLAQSIRREYGAEKLTEQKLEQLINLKKEYQSKQDQLLKDNLVVAKWEAMWESWRQRSYMIDHDCRLFLSGLHSNLTIKSDNVGEADYEIIKRQLKLARKLKNKKEK